MPKLKDFYIFITGTGRATNRVTLGLRSKKLEKEEVKHSVFGSCYTDGEPKLVKGMLNWDTQAMCMVKKPSEKMLAVSEDGEVFTHTAEQTTEEKIPDVSVSVLNLGVIGGYAYACGVWRQVFKRIGEGEWKPMHATEPSQKEKKGGGCDFLAISGFSENDIYAVGSCGEIWHYDGKTWRQCQSPATTDLNAVVCAPDGSVYAAGDDGALVQGRADKWTLIKTGNGASR